MNSIFVVTISDVIGLALFAMIMAAFAAIKIHEWASRAICRHDGGVNETSACDAICRKCGKNLGFIGSWREKNMAAQTERGSQ